MSSSSFKWIQFIGDRKPDNFLKVKSKLKLQGYESSFFPAELELSHYWPKLKDADIVILTFIQPSLAAIFIEAIQELDPQFEIEKKIIIAVDSLNRAESIGFKELGIEHMVSPSWINQSTYDLLGFITKVTESTTKMSSYLKVRRLLKSRLISFNDANLLIEQISGLYKSDSAEYRNLLAQNYLNNESYDEAETLWHRIIDQHENFYDAYEGLAKLHLAYGNSRKALEIYEKLQATNPASLRRLIDMANIHLQSNQLLKAEHLFKAAMEKNKRSNRALNGLSEVMFHQGSLDACRELLKRSKTSHLVAAKLNKMGVSLVKIGNFKEAISHYQKALYVLSSADKGAKLFYNIALAHIKFGKAHTAKKYLSLALTKDAQYEKAKQILHRLETA